MATPLRRSAEPAEAGSGLLALTIDPQDVGLSLGEASYRALCRALRDGVFRPGDRLREEDIAKTLAVSRTPIREALGRLQERRLVEPSGGRGLVVRRLEVAEVLELYALREILEGAAARLASQHASDPEIEMMERLEDALEAAIDSEPDMGRLNRALHETIFRAARNRYVDSALRDMQDSLALLGPTTFGVSGRPQTATREHRAIIGAIKSRNPDLAEQRAREHMRTALQARLRLLSGN